MRVLIVDDDKLIRDEIKSLIDWQKEGFQLVFEAANGKDALNWLASHQADIVITDIAMPVTDGIDLIRGLKAKGFRGQILVMSNYQEFDYVKDAMKLGAFDYCLKYKLDSASLLALLHAISLKIKDTAQEQEKEQKAWQAQLVKDACLFAPVPGQAERFYRLRSHDPFHLLYVRGPQPDSPASTALEGFSGAQWVLLSPGEWIVLFQEDFISSAQRQRRVAECANRIRQGWSGVRIVLSSCGIRFEQLYQQAAGLREHSRMLFYSPSDIVLTGTEPAFETLLPQAAVTQLYDSLCAAVSQVRESGFAAGLHTFLCTAEKLRCDPRIVLGHLEGAALQIIQHMQKMEMGGQAVEELQALIRCMSSGDMTAQQVEARFLAAMQGYFRCGALVSSREMRLEIVRAVQYMHGSLARSLTLQDVASHVGLSRNHFCTIFRQEMGKNFVDYLSFLRMEESKRLLKDSVNKIQEVACQVGIDNTRYFCKLFRDHTGMSPTEYRRNAHER